MAAETVTYKIITPSMYIMLPLPKLKAYNHGHVSITPLTTIHDMLIGNYA